MLTGRDPGDSIRTHRCVPGLTPEGQGRWCWSQPHTGRALGDPPLLEDGGNNFKVKLVRSGEFGGGVPVSRDVVYF